MLTCSANNIHRSQNAPLITAWSPLIQLNTTLKFAATSGASGRVIVAGGKLGGHSGASATALAGIVLEGTAILLRTYRPKTTAYLYAIAALAGPAK